MNNTLTTHHHNNLKALALIYGVSAAAVLTLAVIVAIACFCSRRRLLQPPSHHDGASVTSDDESVAIEAGLCEELIKSYPKIIYRQFKIENGDSAVASSCSICLAEYNDNDTLLLLPDCSHIFHLNCIDLWFKRHPSCPICRKLPPVTESAGDNHVAAFNLWFVPFMQ